MPRLGTRLTERLVEALQCPTKGQRFVADAGQRGLTLVLNPGGSKTWLVRYTFGGRERKMALGRWPEVSVAQARKRAVEVLAQVAAGMDPQEERATKEGMTYGDWVAVYLQQKAGTPSYRHYLYTLKGGRGGRGHQPQPSPAWKRWANRPLASIGPDEAADLIRELARRGAAFANRARAYLSACFAQAKREGYIEANPFQGAPRFKERPVREPYLFTKEELQRLDAAIAALEDPEARAYFVLLRTTGARPGEPLRLRWADLDLDGNPPVVRFTRTKTNTTRTLPLQPVAVEALQALPRISEWVFPGQNLRQPRVDAKRWWDDLRARAGLPRTCRLYSIRHLVATELVRAIGLHGAQLVLGHLSPTMTAKVYSHVKPLDYAAELARVLPFLVRGKIS